ncbi:hypothetical protein HN419_04300 [Candidatus Woesearchaeota archaeon]|jgi:D-aminoacyl-tRNA deacylase|nr:hypothetical protein [Candidatus Woesearchaeota archaeon]MBT3537901.1 hypothetical protein [Candidatus Woesearchaeota archaeon]MBT4698033.1 hypothetical protein [Candidatus Woesearchaeota archaeon]MBT4716960.1 hypothetical protein [Candidatus Woesearchaeota archaeon]MBT7105570.1 hypothetical protein [Candidatus Woesearchaeota archaeon]
MKFAVIVSTKDAAGMNIKERLLERFDFKENGEKFGHPSYFFENIELYTTDLESVDCEEYDKELDVDVVVFATKHQAASGVQSLSVHAPGNWGDAGLGGKEKTLCVAPSCLLKFALLKLKELNSEKELGYEVIQECTHHGPYMEKPVMFIEIGSEEKSWERKDAAEVIADTILHFCRSLIPSYPIAFGIGGLHHTPRFTSLMYKTDYCFGHVCPKYRLEDLDSALVKEAMEKSGAEKIFLEWKGLAGFKEKVTTLLDDMGLEYEKVK